MEVVVSDLPGQVQEMAWSTEGDFWIFISGMRTATVDWTLRSKRLIRKIMLRLPDTLVTLLDWSFSSLMRYSSTGDLLQAKHGLPFSRLMGSIGDFVVGLNNSSQSLQCLPWNLVA